MPQHPMVAFALEALRAAGGDPGPCASPGELPAVFDAAAAVDPHIGLRAGRSVVYRATNPVIYLMMSSPTLADAFAGLSRFAVVLLNRPSKLDVGDARELGWDGQGSAAWSDFVGGALLGLCAWVVGREVRPVEIHLRHARPVAPGPYRAVFGREPIFASNRNALLLSGADWVTPSAHTDPQLYALHREFLERQERRLQEERLVSRVREAVAVRVGGRPAGLEDVASALGMGGRTLQRRLKAQDTSFAEVIDGVRRERVLLLLRVSDASLDAIAAQSGFTDASSVSRAVVRWTGVTPGAFRATQAG